MLLIDVMRDVLCVIDIRHHQNQMKKFLNEFKTFISRGNVMDMAIGVVIATAFGKISASLVADIIMPLIGCLIGGVDLATLNITLKPAVMDGETVVSEAVVGRF